ncbi:M-phase inducer phosphatase 1-A-like [Littorina saxatilis]|uniref:M-phase inducer phosphatase n=1 Tax=Littorina saxatilis TaxID=31220 RepID=A0AAN9BTH5_9CAEN
MGDNNDSKSEDEFDMGSADLFFGGTASSPRKVLPADGVDEKLIQKDGLLVPHTESPVVIMPRLMVPGLSQPLAQSSPRMVRKESEDGKMEEFRMNTPVIRRSKSLALRRVTSDLCSSSPHFQDFSPIPKRQRCAESRSGRESESTEADDEAGCCLQSEEESATVKAGRPYPSKLSGRTLDDSVSAVVRIPFENMLVRQDSQLFDDTDRAPGKVTELQKEFKINRRWSGRRQKENEECRLRKAAKVCKERLLHGESSQNPEEQRIKSAVEVLTGERGGVIADGTVPYALPCFQGKKEELMFISVDTLAQLMDGGFQDAVDHFEVIDCRYPYEYEGGHIMRAVNMYKADSIGEIMSWKTREQENGTNSKRMVLVFHCEFSSQRGPTMMRLLRNTDRSHNFHCYPHLCHPEIYLLSGGYKAFYEKYPDLCDPQAYIPMSHHDYQNELRLFRSKATTWHGKDVRTKHSHSIIF